MNKKIFIIVVVFLIIDQVSKLLVTSFINDFEILTIIDNFFYMTNTQNYGVAFGLFKNNYIFIYLATLFCSLVLYKFMFSFKSNLRNIFAFGLVISGLLGNLLDRIFLGYVRDFISIRVFDYNYPIFNISDMCIVIGVFLLIYAIIKGEDKVENKSSSK